MTAPLLSPTDITPRFDFDSWLQTPSPAATASISPNAAYSEFAAAINNRAFAIPHAPPPLGNSISVPTRTIPYTRASLPQLDPPSEIYGESRFHPAHSVAERVAELVNAYLPDVSFFDFIEDDMMVQAIHNSYLDLLSGHQGDSSEMLISAPFQDFPISEWENINEMDMLDHALLPQPEVPCPPNVEAIHPEPAKHSCEIVTDNSPAMHCQPSQISPSQRMAIYNLDSKGEDHHEQVWGMELPVASSSLVSTSPASPKELYQGNSKSVCRGTMMKAKNTTFINRSVNSTGIATTVDSSSPVIRKRRSLDNEERREAAIIRQIKACERCRRGKRKCKRHQVRFFDLFRINLHTLKLPCMFLNFEEARLFRLAPNKEHPMRCSDIVYQSLELSRQQYDFITLCLTQDYGSELIVEVAQFDPNPGDKTAHMWHGRAVELPPYCIVGIQKASRKMMDYVRYSRNSILLEQLSNANEITREVLLQADRYQRRSQNILVQQALDLFAATRIIERDWRICGPETLGIPVIHDPFHTGSPKIPITPVMDGQLDQIVTKDYLLPLRERFLENLQKTIYAGKKEDWFSSFLSTFIYLTHIECLLQHSRRNAKRYKLKRRYNDISLAEKYFEASRIALAHFHFVANAATPLQLDWKNSDVAAAANLDEDQAAFMVNVLAKMTERKKDGSARRMKVRHRYEEPLYFCHQLFEEKWEAAVGKIVIHEEVVVG